MRSACVSEAFPTARRYTSQQSDCVAGFPFRPAERADGTVLACHRQQDLTQRESAEHCRYCGGDTDTRGTVSLSLSW